MILCFFYSTDDSPDGDYTPDSQKSDEKLKSLGNVQTYREYKEALRQQRNHDSSSIYRPKEQLTPPDGSPAALESPTAIAYKSQTSTPSPTNYANVPNQISHTQSPHHQFPKSSKVQSLPMHLNGHSPARLQHSANGSADGASQNVHFDESGNKKPTQKVTPSRNSNATYQSPTHWTINGNHKSVEITTTVTKEYSVYVKPSSPTKMAGNGVTGSVLSYNNVPASPTGQNGNNTKVIGTTPKAPR